MNAHVAKSNTMLRFIFYLKVKSKLSRVLWGSRNPACFAAAIGRYLPCQADTASSILGQTVMDGKGPSSGHESPVAGGWSANGKLSTRRRGPRLGSADASNR